MTNAIVKADQNVNAALAEKGVFTTVTGETLDDRVKVFNAINSSTPLADVLGDKLSIVDIVVQKVEVANTETCEVEEAPRVILITKDGKALSATSKGMLSAIKNIISFLGAPSTWEKPLTFVATEKRGRNGYRFMTLDLA